MQLYHNTYIRYIILHTYVMLMNFSYEVRPCLVAIAWLYNNVTWKTISYLVSHRSRIWLSTLIIQGKREGRS